MPSKPFANPAALLLTSVALSLTVTAPAKAQALTGLHSKIHVGNKICFASHEHTGHARVRGSRRASARAAVHNWSSFTNLEYGPTWANFRKAEGRKLTCRSVGASYSCKVTARPCR